MVELQYNEAGTPPSVEHTTGGTGSHVSSCTYSLFSLWISQHSLITWHSSVQRPGVPSDSNPGGHVTAVTHWTFSAPSYAEQQIRSMTVVSVAVAVDVDVDADVDVGVGGSAVVVVVAVAVTVSVVETQYVPRCSSHTHGQSVLYSHGEPQNSHAPFVWPSGRMQF